MFERQTMMGHCWKRFLAIVAGFKQIPSIMEG